MRYEKRIYLSFAWVLIGLVIITLSLFNIIQSYEWITIGTVLTILGALQIITHLKYLKNPEYKEKLDTEINDERNKFLSMKAWSWAGYLYVIIASVATIVFMILKQQAIMMVASLSVCLMLILYWIIYLVLKRKY